MIKQDKVTELYFIIDEFNKQFDAQTPKRIGKPGAKCRMSESEIMAILIAFHASPYKNFKYFYLYQVLEMWKNLFPQALSYNRFVELISSVTLKLLTFLTSFGLQKCTGISYVDSTPIRVCSNKRINRNKVFDGLAKVGKSTMGWFFGFKLHVILSEKGQIINFLLTTGNVNDQTLLENQFFMKKIIGKRVADKGYIAKKTAENLKKSGVELITNFKKNMKNQLISLKDKILLRKRSLIETFFGKLKQNANIEHTRHRSQPNFFVTILSALTAYQFLMKKPQIKF